MAGGSSNHHHPHALSLKAAALEIKECHGINRMAID